MVLGLIEICVVIKNDVDIWVVKERIIFDCFSVWYW